MKNVIYNYYNILLTDINESNDNYYFYYNSNLYVFYLIENNPETINEIYNFLIENNIDSYKIIANKDNNFITTINNKNYALLHLKGLLKYEIKFEEFKYYPIAKTNHNWGTLWSNKLDYYEIQIRELGKKYQTLLNSFGFFKGIAENAILYYNLTEKKFNDEVPVAIVHNRMNYPEYEIDYNNPLNFVIDYYIRDISEYIKSYAISDYYDLENIITLINKLTLNSKSFNLLYSRLLYPTFYFDEFDKIILGREEDNKIINVINKIQNYLEMLKKIFIVFNNKYEMFNIEWLNKNVEN